MSKIKVLFVCMGNICRSPTAEGVFSKIIKDNNLDHHFKVDSAGTHAYHVGEKPDNRAQKAALERGFELKHIRARKFLMQDFDIFDFILVMDGDNYSILMEASPEEHRHKIKYFLDYAPQLGVRDVPDPYYGGRFGFERVLDLVEEASKGFMETIQSENLIGEG